MAISQKQLAACATDPVEILRVLGKEPLPWEERLLRSKRDTILNIHRKGGKSYVVAAAAIHQAEFHSPESLGRENNDILIICPSQEQAQDTMRYCLAVHHGLGAPVPVIRENEKRVEFANGSRIKCIPAVERTARGPGPMLIILDEGSRIPDDVISKAVGPMRAESKGRLIIPSTPAGQKGFFYHQIRRAQEDLAAGRTPDFDYIEWTADKTPWIGEEWIERERRLYGDDYVAQEYFCSFTTITGVIYPDFESCLVDELPPNLLGEAYGGIDWGWQDPFAACPAILEQDTDILWVISERYVRHCPLHEHVKYLQGRWGERTWVSDPRSPASVRECRAAGLNVRPAKIVGKYEIEPGIAAVTARIKTGRLKVLKRACPNMLWEAQMYKREDTENDKGQRPIIDAYNHLMDALRYMVTWVDRTHIARLRLDERADTLASEAAIQQELELVAAQTAEERWQQRRPWKDRDEWEQWAVEQPEYWRGDGDYD